MLGVRALLVFLVLAVGCAAEGFDEDPSNAQEALISPTLSITYPTKPKALGPVEQRVILSNDEAPSGSTWDGRLYFTFGSLRYGASVLRTALAPADGHTVFEPGRFSPVIRTEQTPGATPHITVCPSPNATANPELVGSTATYRVQLFGA